MSDAARERLKNLVKTAPDTMGRASDSTVFDFARAAGQGLSFGFGDESLLLIVMLVTLTHLKRSETKLMPLEKTTLLLLMEQR